MRAAFGAGAALFAVAVLIVLHVVLFEVARGYLSPLQASLGLLVLDLIVAIVLGVLAIRNTPDAIEAEAHQLRQQALIEMRQSLTVMGMAASVVGMAVRTGARSGVRRGAATALAEVASRFIGR